MDEPVGDAIIEDKWGDFWHRLPGGGWRCLTDQMPDSSWSGLGDRIGADSRVFVAARNDEERARRQRAVFEVMDLEDELEAQERRQEL